MLPRIKRENWIYGAVAALATAACSAATEGRLAMDSVRGGTWRFGGEIGRRVEANVEHWLLRAPGANPGMLDMFHRRDRHLPYNEPVPWAGEFAGKYLISAVQACRMSDNATLKPFVGEFVDALVTCQAEDGYLGPWPKHERLLGHWDLWGHYHCMLGLLMWSEDTNDTKALDCALRAADCICDLYASGTRRPFDAGTPQINLAVLHVMALLHRRTADPRYWTLIERILEDMQRDGDWLRLGAKGTPYHRLPGGGTRWESLHIVQGLVELYSTTGDQRYRRAAVSLWKSIRDFDRHPSGAFSTHERACGSPYEIGSIETCCSVAWLALTIDVLRLTGDAAVADELELTTWNQVLAAQHPSGSWWTYDTPLNGVRAPCYHQIRFQYRPGAPELNCCSVNAPRGLGMLSEWAVLEDTDGLVVNFYGPCEFALPRPRGDAVTLLQETNYPLDGAISIRLRCQAPGSFTVKLRVPAWSKTARATVNLEEPVAGEPGKYLVIRREWRDGDRIALRLDMAPRHWLGAQARHAHVAVYRGPLLLTFDAAHNPIETADFPPLNLDRLTLSAVPVQAAESTGRFPPMGLWKAPADDGTRVVLCDFAGAGAHGTDYLAWLPAARVPPPPVTLDVPAAEARGAPGRTLFRWSVHGPHPGTYTLTVARDAACTDRVAHLPGLQTRHAIVDRLPPGPLYWQVETVGDGGATASRNGPCMLHVDPSAKPFFTMGEKGLLLDAPLEGSADPRLGRCTLERAVTPATDRHGKQDGALAFNGRDSMIRYELPYFPETDYCFHAWVFPQGLPTPSMQQVFSGWCVSVDDPLRVTLLDNQLTARIEAGGMFATPGIELVNGTWYHVAAVKAGPALTLYVNGEPVGSAPAPEIIRTRAVQVGVGANPFYQGGEVFRGRIDDVAFHTEALTADEIRAIYESTRATR